jgi:hypothetical protein
LQRILFENVFPLHQHNDAKCESSVESSVVNLFTGVSVTSFEEIEDGTINVSLSDGQVVNCDLFVGADGINSAGLLTTSVVIFFDHYNFYPLNSEESAFGWQESNGGWDAIKLRLHLFPKCN